MKKRKMQMSNTHIPEELVYFAELKKINQNYLDWQKVKEGSMSSIRNKRNKREQYMFASL